MRLINECVACGHDMLTLHRPEGGCSGTGGLAALTGMPCPCQLAPPQPSRPESEAERG